MWIIIVNLILAAGPALLLLLYFYRRDKNKKEPPKLVWKAFLFGLIAVIPAIIVELIGAVFIPEDGGLGAIAADAFIVTALVEEVMKFLAIRLIVWKWKEFDEVMDGIVYTVAASLGFAMLENLLYSFGPTSVVLIRGFTAVPLHAISAGLMGYYLGLAKVRGKKTVFLGILFAVLLHGLYDFLLFTQTAAAFLVVPLLIASWFILRRLIKKAAALDREHRGDWDIPLDGPDKLNNPT